MPLVGPSNLNRAKKKCSLPYVIFFQNLKPYKSERSFQIERFTSSLQGNFVKGAD
jgi:hypothetical protein